MNRVSLATAAASAALLLLASSAAPDGAAAAAGSPGRDQCFSDDGGYRVATMGGGSLYILSGRDLYRGQVEGACPGLPDRAGLKRPYLIARARHFFCVGEVNDIYAPSRGSARDRCPFVITAKLSPAQAAVFSKQLH
jgi:hypothetical protein